MLPHPSKGDTEGTLGGRNPTLEGKMACMCVAGYAACAKSNVALDAVLDEIKVGLGSRFWSGQVLRPAPARQGAEQLQA